MTASLVGEGLAPPEKRRTAGNVRDRAEILVPAVGDGVLDVPSIRLLSYGKTVAETLQEIEETYAWLSLDRFVIMPNHIHLLLRIGGNGPSGTPAPTNADGGPFTNGPHAGDPFCVRRAIRESPLRRKREIFASSLPPAGSSASGRGKPLPYDRAVRFPRKPYPVACPTPGRRGRRPLRNHRLACFWRRVKLSAIMAMNSLFVGLPLIFDTV